MKAKSFKRLDIPRTHDFTGITLRRLDRMVEQGKPLPRGHYLLVETFYDGGPSDNRDLLIDALGRDVGLRADSGCMLVGPRTRDHAWRTRKLRVASWLASAARLIKGVRVTITWASPVKGGLVPEG